MPNWTKEQKQAIDTENTNIIVSAGAGSGKTAVLTERVLRKLNEGININELLILTFTRAAAYEMKERIRKKIKENPNLKEQLNLLDTAYITTFDSFALSVVKKYHYLLGVTPSISIGDSSLINLEKERILDNIFNDLYRKNDPLFTKLIGDLCVKDDTQIRKYILSIDEKLSLKIDKDKYIENYKQNFCSNEKIDQGISLYIDMLKQKIKEVKDSLYDISIVSDGDYYNKLEASLKGLLESTTYDDIKLNSNVKLANLPKNSCEELKAYKEKLKKVCDNLSALCSYDDIDDIKNKIVMSYDYVTIILDIIRKLGKEIMSFKTKNNFYEFNDIIKMAIKVVECHPNVKDEISSSLKEIMVDEYQDTNDLQEYFISLIGKNNVYMVGDVKQSIYRFRNANPNIFREKYNKYALNNDGIKIDLKQNFRSREEVLNNINLLFDFFMDDDIGGADYKKAHQMIFGNKDYEINKPNQDYNLKVYYYDNNQKYSNEEIEYFFIANDVKKKIECQYQIYDKDLKQYRNAEYRDFVILVDRGKTFGLAKKIFEYNGIPLTICRDESITNAYDQIVIKNIVCLITKQLKQEYDDEYKYLFVSLARSFLFEYKDDLIFKLIKDNLYKDDKIIEKIKKLTINIHNIGLANLLNNIIEEFNLYEKFIKIGNINDCMIRIEYLYDVCVSLEKAGYTIYDFGEYLKNINEKGYEIKVSSEDDGSNSVKIMTIHKSKGLEFPICYFPCLTNKFNLSDMKDRFIYSDNYGIIAPYYQNGVGKNIYYELVKKDYIVDEVSESIRKFYVALTRAKEQLIMILPYPKNNKSFNKDDRINYRNFSDFIYSMNNYLDKYTESLDINDLNLSKDYNFTKKLNLEKTLSNEKIKINKLNIDYVEITEKKFSKEYNEIITEDKDKSRELGLEFHECLEYLNFKNPNFELIKNEFLKMKIKKFLNNEIIKDIGDATIYKETEFKYIDGKTEYHGIIDLMLEYDNHIDIIDYKLKNITSDSYKNQLNGYKNYISKIKDKEINLYLYSIIDEMFYKI